jgi:hypothetical protein
MITQELHSGLDEQSTERPPGGTGLGDFVFGMVL